MHVASGRLCKQDTGSLNCSCSQPLIKDRTSLRLSCIAVQLPTKTSSFSVCFSPAP
uniref:Uncharacterized protein n=1 Tax=Aegilops tauschii subsp. strangulata TaxID=200361 RepID=A0A453QUC3_AEGTS